MVNSNVNPARITLEKDELNNLVNQVNETIVTKEKAQFGAVDLWNIQRQKKLATRINTKWILN